MPLPEPAYRHVDTSRSPTIATMEQFLRGGEASRVSRSPTYSPTSSSPSSPFFERLKHHDLEEDHGHYQKKSVITKVKEKARKLRHSLSKKKQEDGNVTPSWGVSLEDDEEEEEEDAEYLGAPMYESELSPEGYKENARQHPRASPVISEKHVLPSSSTFKSGVEQDRENSLSPAQSMRTTQPATTIPPGLNKTMTETVADKLTPAYAEGSDAAHSISSKIQGLVVSGPVENQNSPSLAAARKTSLSLSATQTPPAKLCSQTSSIAPRTSSAPMTTQIPSSSSPPLCGKNTSHIYQMRDKGVSVQEYSMNRFEPGDDEKALSEVISEAMSPRTRRTPGDVGVMEKVRGAINSFLRNEEPSQYAVRTPTTRASSQIPISTSIEEVGQEENHGRILQAN